MVHIYVDRIIFVYAFFSAWLKQATEKQMKIFLSVWFITLFLPYCQEYISSYIGGTCAWNDYGTLYYFSGFSGYLLFRLLFERQKQVVDEKDCCFISYSFLVSVMP